MSEKKPSQPLWTFDFTVITVGSLISMAGATLANFAISLLVLDDTGSTFLYMLFNVAAQLPMLILPVLAGPLLDRVSRKRVIYTLDFLSAAIYLTLFLLLGRGWFNAPVLLLAVLLTGSIDSVYMVAYESFYPNLITPGNQSRAYSVSSILGDLAAMTAPVAAALYAAIGSVVPIFAATAACFFTAACFERTIRCQESHIAPDRGGDGLSAVRRFRRDFREGVDYIRGERGLLIIALYFTMSGFCGGADRLKLPFFLSHSRLFAAWPLAAATLYAVVSNFNTAGRLAGGLVQYRVRIPGRYKFMIALTVYASLCVLDAVGLFLPVPLMAAAFFLSGVLSVTSYTIRTAATQAYIPDGKRARFNGAFQMITSLGGVAGSLSAGVLAEFFPERGIVVAADLLWLLSVYLLMYRGREHVKKVYNREV